MKNFFQFLNEATESQASMQAKKLNLKSDGHGGWLDTRGKFVAKTVDGKLKFTGKRGPKAARGSSSKKTSSTTTCSRSSKTQSRTGSKT